MIVSAIAAMAQNRVIGVEGGLPWDIPEDMKFFRDTTKGHIIVMGRKTFESFPKPLPNRLHIVITRSRDYHPEGTLVVHSVEEAMTLCQQKVASEKEKWGEEVFVIGGGEIYSAMLPQTDRIYLTEIHAEAQGDAKFPQFTTDEFKEVSRRAGTPHVSKDPETGIDKVNEFDFVVFERPEFLRH